MKIDRVVWLCPDCTIWADNGDSSGFEHDEERFAQVTEGVAKLGPHLTLNSGCLDDGCDPCEEDHEHEEGEIEFSWRGCDACTLAGARRLGGSLTRFAILVEDDPLPEHLRKLDMSDPDVRAVVDDWRESQGE